MRGMYLLMANDNLLPYLRRILRSWSLEILVFGTGQKQSCRPFHPPVTIGHHRYPVLAFDRPIFLTGPLHIS